MATGPDDKDFADLFEGKPGSVLGAFREAAPTEDRRKLVETKEKWAREGRKPRKSKDHPDHGRRLPPGQHLTEDWPVLDLGNRPLIDARDWQLSVAGAVERRITWTWDEFLAQPQVQVTSDIHCVTDWSRYDNKWTGVGARHLLQTVQPRPEAKFVVIHGYDGYTTNVPLAALEADDVLLAHTWSGEPLPRDHGGPVRLVIPSLYFWKSAKWIRHMVFLEQDSPGFWETRGYHNIGDPWKQQRYG